MKRFVLSSGSGSVVVTSIGARVAELRPGPGLPNVLWNGVAPVLGGDRLWIAPETGIFYDGAGRWRCPPELDPGTWTAQPDGDGIVLEQSALGCSLRRRIRAVHDFAVPIGLSWAGYTVEDEVKTDRAWSAWHLVMAPAPARVYVRGGGERVVYYPPAPDARDGWLLASGRPPRWKLGFGPPADGLVVLAALGETDPGPIVVVMASADPAGTYVDTPPGGGRPTAVQVYSSGGEGFCELEHHAPLESRSVASTVLGAWGPLDARRALLARCEEAGPVA